MSNRKPKSRSTAKVRFWTLSTMLALLTFANQAVDLATKCSTAYASISREYSPVTYGQLESMRVSQRW
jgi:hypothetical protein